MVGRKSSVLLDSIDLEILEILSTTSNHIGILDLCNKINLTHQVLKKHLEKLIKGDLVQAVTKEPGRKIELMTYLSHRYDDNKENSIKDLEQARRRFKLIVATLKKLNSIDYEDKFLSSMIKELNKKPLNPTINKKPFLKREL